MTAGIGWSWVDTNIATEPPEVGCWWDPWYGYICTSWVNTRTLDGLTYQLGVGARYDFGNNVAVHPRTIDDPTDMARFLDMGVDGIITDRPDLMLELLRTPAD